MPETRMIAELERKYYAAVIELYEIEQTLGAALGYPRYVDDPKNFPDATEVDGVCTGEMIPTILAGQAAKIITDYETERKNKIFIPVELRGCLLSTIQKSKNFLVELLRIVEESLENEPRENLDGWRAEIAEYDEIIQAIVGNDDQASR